NIKRLSRSDANASTLTDCVSMQACVLADHSSLRSSYFSNLHLSRTHFVTRVVFDKTRIIAIRHEANLLALGFLGGFQSHASRDFTHFRLGLIAERKHRSLKLLLGHFKQKVRLILRVVSPLP